MLLKQKNIVHRLAIAATCVLSVTTASYGQILYPDRPANRPLILLEEQYQQNEYAVAAQSARQYLHLHTDREHLHSPRAKQALRGASGTRD